MGVTVLLCTDGSDLSVEALRRGLAVVRPDARPVVATVIDGPDPMMVTGSGFAGGTMSAVDFDRLHDAAVAEGRALVERVVGELGLSDAATQVLEGDAGPALCALATELAAGAMVVGTRGRGGLKRAVLGSVSDHIVRNAPCPVVVTGERRAPDRADPSEHTDNLRERP